MRVELAESADAVCVTGMQRLRRVRELVEAFEVQSFRDRLLGSAPGAELVLRLFDGSVVRGRFAGAGADWVRIVRDRASPVAVKVSAVVAVEGDDA